MYTPIESQIPKRENAEQLAEFIIFSQQRFLLDMMKDLSNAKISLRHLFLLGHIARGNSPRMGDITQLMGHSSAATSSLVKRLVKLGYVEQVRSQKDARIVRVIITDSGRELAVKMKDQMERRLVGANSERRELEPESWGSRRLAIPRGHINNPQIYLGFGLPKI